jgi:hypothetical protein
VLFLDSKEFDHLLLQMSRWKDVAAQELVNHDRGDLQLLRELMLFQLLFLHGGADRSSEFFFRSQEDLHSCQHE